MSYRSYSLDLRKKVIAFIENGNSITRAARVFNVARATIYRWLDRPNLESIKVERRRRKIDIDKLKRDLEEHPEKTLKERAREFGVVPSAMCYQLKRLKTKTIVHSSSSKDSARC